ncbi:MAG TPA: GNAT family N-acetyltransferase [Caulobacteraceae bacterium]|nr:GNAT family N-acetyltransferase [Caulobacteraceae bacterium]
MIVRPYRAEDAEGLSALYLRSVSALGARDYDAEQVRAWASLAPSPERFAETAADGRLRLVAADAHGRPLAFADLTGDGFIDFLYRDPDAPPGAAGAVYEALERAARDRRVEALGVHASEAARRFFLKRGFQVCARRDFEVAGVPIHNYAMEKRLGDEGL